ncbi:MAG: flavodoxin family protein [Candidatus Heimdallarchaeaceae archaeon]
MSFVILNGMYKDDSFIPRINQMVSDEFQRNNYVGDSVILHDEEIKPCLGCFKCWVQTPGICIIDDYGREVAKKMIQSDVLVYITPITYGGYSAELKKAVDRSLGLIAPFFRVHENEIHHEMRYDKYPNLLVIGTLDKPSPDQEEIFTTLVKRNVLNLFCPKYTSKIIYTDDDEATIKKKIEESIGEVGA